MQLFANNIETTLASSLTDSATSMTVTSAAGMPAPTGSDYFLLTLCKRSNNVESSFEVVKVTGVSGTTLTIVRAQEDTSGTAYSSGDIASLRLTAVAIERPQFSTVAKTANYTLSSSDCNGFTTFTNTGASGTINFTLPSGADGLRVKFIAVNAHTVKVTPASGEKIHYSLLPSNYDDAPSEVVTGGSYYSTSGAKTRTYDGFLSCRNGDSPYYNYLCSSATLVWLDGKWRTMDTTQYANVNYTDVDD